MMFLLFLSCAMFFGSYVAGMIPIAFTLSGTTLRFVSVLGAGLLVGTSLAVIIPEGINTLFSSHIVKPVKVLVQASSSKVTADVEHVHNHDESGHDMASIDALREAHSVIGITLVLGFIFMLLVDQIGNFISNRRSVNDAEGGSVNKQKTKITATLGLVVHAAADGIALGAAATTSHTDIEMIVFVAIMLHKAPAAFGLVTFLMHEGLDRMRIRKHLLIFSLAAPLTALVTYFGISQSAKEALSNYNATGVAMLFSAGTFLYVATVHVLPEISNHSGHSHGGPPIPSPDASDGGFTKMELFAFCAGALLPVFLTVGHHH